jgi:thioredoxin reductase (NADPH)
MTENSNTEIYDILIIGGGAAGLSAGIYAERGGKKTIILEGKLIGGQLYNTDLVDNYVGFSMIKGFELAQKMEEHIRKIGLKVEMAMVKKISLGDDKIKLVETEDGRIFKAKTVILASGGNPRYLGVPGEKQFSKKGVSYCAVCDGAFYKGDTIATVGGGDAACEEAIYLTNHAEKIYLIHRRDELRASYAIQQAVFDNPKIEIIWDTVIEKINGSNMLESVTLKNVKTGKTSELKIPGLFIFIGFIPNTDFLDFEVDKDSEGYIKVDDAMRTSVQGIYAIGDARAKIARQIAISAGDGATAAIAATKYLDQPEE